MITSYTNLSKLIGYPYGPILPSNDFYPCLSLRPRGCNESGKNDLMIFTHDEKLIIPELLLSD